MVTRRCTSVCLRTNDNLGIQRAVLHSCLKESDERLAVAAVTNGHYEVARTLQAAGAELGWDEVETSGEL